MPTKLKKDDDEIKFEDILSSISVIATEDKGKVDPSSKLGEASHKAGANDEAPEAVKSKADDNVLVLTDIAPAENIPAKEKGNELADDGNTPDESAALSEEELVKEEEIEERSADLKFDKTETALDKLIHEIFIETLRDMISDYLKDRLAEAIEGIARKELIRRQHKGR